VFLDQEVGNNWVDGIGLWLGNWTIFQGFFRCLDESWKWYELIFVKLSGQILVHCVVF
jgi:hypothetical protein